MASISNLTLEDRVIDTRDPEIAAALAELYPHTKNPFPLCEQELSFVISGVRAAISNAFQRVMTQELTGHHLTADIASMGETTDPFMKPEFVIYQRIQNIPLVFGLTDPASFEFRLDVTNDTKAVMAVHAGDIAVVKGKLTRPIFNPTIEVASLQPGKRIVIDKITIADGVGRVSAPANVAIRGRHIALDLKRLPKEKTHKGLQGDAQRSGFATPSTLADPKKFKVVVSIAAGERGSTKARGLPLQACNNIIMRLRQVMDTIDRSSDAASAAAKSAAVADMSSWSAEQAEDSDLSVGTLNLRGETATIPELLRTELNIMLPDLAYCGIARSAETTTIGLQVSRHCDPAELQANVKHAAKNLMATFSSLRSQL